MSSLMSWTIENGLRQIVESARNSMYVPFALRQSFSKRAPEVEHPHLRADRPVRPGDFVHQHRFARARRADDGEVVVAEIVVVEVERHQLAAAATEDQRRGARPRHSAMSGARWMALPTVLRDTRRIFRMSAWNFSESVIGRLARSACRCM